MPAKFPWLIGLLLAASPAVAQPSTLHPAQTIALGAHSTVGGTVVLPNHNTVLLLTDAESPNIIVQCLAPDGRTLWKTTTTRFGHAVYGSGYIFDSRQIAIGQEARADKQLQREKVIASLFPVSVLTDGNDVVMVERISAEVAKGLAQNGATTMVEGQVYVQRLNAQGVLTKHLFEPRPEPASKQTIARTMAGYADANGYVEVVREKDKDEEKGIVAFYTMHYDLKANTMRREKLELPATPVPPSRLNSFRLWYQEWAYLGHHANHTYFCRRTLVSSPSEKPGQQPITYEVYLVDDKGAPAPGGFRTTLDLDKGTIPVYSGALPSYGELAHIPHGYTQRIDQGYVTNDEWETTSGGIGSFYLDRATGDVLIFGEYGEGKLPEADPRPALKGFFERRYAAEGRLVAQLQTPYTDEMRATLNRLAFRSFAGYREPQFNFDPLTGYSQYNFSVPRGLASNEGLALFLDRDLKLQRYEFLPGKNKDERMYTNVWFAAPFWVYKVGGTAANMRSYEHAAPTDLPVYAALEKLRQAAGTNKPDYKFYLSPTGPGTGLVVEKPQAIGGALNVYTF